MIITATLDELNIVVEQIKMQLPDGGIVLLHGDVATGKTTLTQAFVKSFGVVSAVTSPTFSLQQVYSDELYHYDLYNKGVEHFLSLGLFDALEASGFHLIEWADEQLKEMLIAAGFDMVEITIDSSVPTQRTYTITKE
jgi:tRNA threonylcarbamoyladenosine biosynthesis protein TsaE